jgi:hypothetical protein
MEIPRTMRDKHVFKSYLKSLQPTVGVFGRTGAKVGIGFVWETQTGLGEGGLNTLSRRMQRALKAAGLLDNRADIYFLIQRINYIRSGEPNAIFEMREG